MLAKNDILLLELAKQGGADKELLLLDKIVEVENLIKRLEEKINSTLGETRDEVINVNKIIGQFRGKEGPQGEIGPQGERGLDGKDGLNGKDGINGKNGKNGRNGIDGKDGLNGRDGKDGVDGKDGKDAEFDSSFIDTFQEDLKKLREEVKVKPVGGFRALRAATFSFSGDGATTSFNLPKIPGAKGKAIWSYYQGQYLQQGVHFTVKNRTFDTLGGTSTFTPESGAVIEGFIFLF